MLKYLIQKEFKQIRRNSFIPKILVVLPLMVILVFPWVANQEITNINVDIVDRDGSSYSRRLTEKIAASGYFNLTALSSSNEEAVRKVEKGTADLILELPADFEKNLVNQGFTEVMISANAVNIMKGGLGSNYMAGIIQDFAGEIRSELVNSQPSTPTAIGIATSHLNRFNPFLDYKIFMIPALLVMLITIICGFLPALNIVTEKEIGTIEQINVTPVSKIAFILAKLIPSWIIGLTVMTIYMTLAALIYRLIPAGNLITVYFFALLYILVVSGLGLIISNYSSTIQQAMFMMFFFMIIMILISGLFTPINSMPAWAKTLTLFNPLRYFVEVMRMVYLKGSNILQLGQQLMSLAALALVLNTWAVLSYKKNG